MWFLLCYSPKPRSQVRICLFRGKNENNARWLNLFFWEGGGFDKILSSLPTSCLSCYGQIYVAIVIWACEVKLYYMILVLNLYELSIIFSMSEIRSPLILFLCLEHSVTKKHWLWMECCWRLTLPPLPVYVLVGIFFGVEVYLERVRTLIEEGRRDFLRYRRLIGSYWLRYKIFNTFLLLLLTRLLFVVYYSEFKCDIFSLKPLTAAM